MQIPFAWNLQQNLQVQDTCGQEANIGRNQHNQHTHTPLDGGWTMVKTWFNSLTNTSVYKFLYPTIYSLKPSHSPTVSRLHRLHEGD